MKKNLLFVIAFFAISLISIGQATNDYRSAATGDWNILSTWERYNGATWVTPTAGEGTPNSTDLAITILSGHTVTVTAAVTVDQVTVNSGGKLTISSGIIVTLANGTSDDLTVNGTGSGGYALEVSGTISLANISVLKINGTAIIPTGGAVFGTNDHTISIAVGGSLTVQSTGNVNSVGWGISSTDGNGGAQILVNGTLTIDGGTVRAEHNNSLLVNGSLSIGGTGNLTSTKGSGGTLATINSGGSVTLSGTASWTIGGSGNAVGEVLSGGTIEIGPSALVNGIGDFVLNSGATLRIGSVNGITTSPTASGNVQNTGGIRTFDVGANYTYNGTANQNMGNGFPNNLTGILTINNPGNTVTLDNPRTIASGGSVAFTSGLLSTTTTNLLTFGAGSSVSGASDASYATGPVRKIGNTAFAFPVGKSPAGYHQIDISAPSVATDAFTAEYIRASAVPVGAVTPPLDHVSNCEYWQLDRTTGISNVSVTLYWTASSPCNSNPYITGLAALRVARYNGPSGLSTWMDEGASGVSGNNTAGNITTAAAVLIWVPTPTYFTLASTSSESPLPVKLSSIKAYEKQQGVQLDWTISQEQNMSRYSVERSADGNSFTSIGQVASRNSVAETKYGFFDASPLPGVNFYRLKIIDMDEKFAFSSIVKVNLDKRVKGISLYPNPVTGGYISFQGAELAKGNYTVRIFNSAGVQVMGQSFSHSGGAINQTLQLPAGTRTGMYSLQLINDSEKVMSKTFIVQ